MKKAIYSPTNQNTIIISELEDYYEILLDGEFKTVPRNEVQYKDDTIKLSSLKEAQRNIFISCVKNPVSDIIYSLNSNRLIPEPHQYKPLTKFLNSKNNRILIADEVGLGKTIEAAMIFKEIKCREDIRISIIVVPSSLTLKWKEELSIRFEEFFEIKKTNQFLAFIDDYENFNSSKVFDEKMIISYHTLRDERVVEKLKDGFLEVDVLIMDEAHTFRNDSTSTFEGAEILTAISDHIIFLTATPVQNDLRDIFNVLSLLDHESFMDFDYFKRMVRPNRIIHHTIALLRNNNSLETIKKSIQEIDFDHKNDSLKKIHHTILETSVLNSEQRVKLIDELNKLDNLSYIINRTKKRDVGRLIPRNANSVIVDITSQEKDFYNAVIDFVRFIHPNTPQGFITIMPERMASSSMLASFESFKKMKKEGKLFLNDIDDVDESYDDLDIRDEAMKYLDKIIEKGKLIGTSDSKFIKFIEIVDSIQVQGINQIIVFSFFKYTLNYLQKKLSDMNYKVGIIHGDYTVEERFDIIKSFKNGAFDILLSSEVGSEGLDMQFCNVVINYDLPWNPMRVEQRIGRIDRIGQKFNKLHIFNLCILGSIEDRIYLRLYDKLNIFEESLGEFEPLLGNLERDLDINGLLDLSQEEINEKIHLKELSIKRQEVEIVTQSKELEKLLSDDIKANTQQEELLSNKKLRHIQSQSSILVKSFFDERGISYFEDKNGTLRLSSENITKLFRLLRLQMSDKKISPFDYKEERLLLHKIQNKKVIRISFDSTQNEDFNTIFVNINHPIVKMITKNHHTTTTYVAINTHLSNSGYAVTFRIDMKHLKKKSWIKTLILNDSFELQKELDYFEFIENTTPYVSENRFDFEEVKEKVNPHIIKQTEKLKKDEYQLISRQIEVMKNSISIHFDKKIKRVKRMEEAIDQDDIRRMRIAERSNLMEQRNNKLNEIEQRKNIASSFEILAIMKIS